MDINDTAAPEYERVPRKQLKFFQGNLKDLTKVEYEHLKANIVDEGFFEPVEVWRDKEGQVWVIDGHQRLQVADNEHWEFPNGVPIRPMPANDRDHAARRLLMLNARYGRVTGQGLYEFISEFNINVDDLPQFTPPEIKFEPFKAEFFDEPEIEPPDPDDPRIEPTGIQDYLDGAILPSSNKWGIPDLREDMLFDDVSLIPTTTWAAQPGEPGGANKMFVWSKTRHKPFEKGMGTDGVLCFYEWDINFDKIWDDAVEAVRKLAEEKWAAVVEPDFSLWSESPLAVQLYTIYRIRWMGRYWQEAGHKVIPNIQAGDDRTYEWAFCGLPKRMPIVAMQMHSSTGDIKRMRNITLERVSRVIGEREVEHVVIYGGGSGVSALEFVKSLPSGPTYHPLPTWTSKRFNAAKERLAKQAAANT